MGDATGAAAAAAWEESYDQTLVRAVYALPYKQRYGVVPFLEWLARCDPMSPGGRVHHFFHGDTDADGKENIPDAMGHERAFADAISEWRDAYLTCDINVAKGTRIDYVAAARFGLEALRDQGFCGIPQNFRRHWIKPGAPEYGTTPSLGAAKWPELEGSQGYDRERRALDMTRAEFVKYFLFYERLFLFGQSLLRGDPPGPDSEPAAREMIRDGLLCFRAGIQKTGSFRLSRNVRDALPKDPDVWRRAGGFDLSDVWGGRFKIFSPYLSAFGPSPPGMIGALGVLLCDTGWNLQPARDLPRNPYVFRSAKNIYIAEQSFIDGFKNRAGHHVLGYLGERSDLDGHKLETATEHWNCQVEAYDPNQQGNGYACLNRIPVDENDITAADLLDRYGRMADALRAEFGSHSERLFGNSFWIFSNIRGARTYNSETRRLACNQIYPESSVLARPGFTLEAIRSTFTPLKRNDTGSFAATKATAGHASSKILQPHYLNTPTINAELDANIRQFQEAMEGIVTRDLDQEMVARKLGKTVSDLERMRRVADQAGITAALGLVQDQDDDRVTDVLHFAPTAERLADLYMIHRKLRQMQAHYPNRARFRKDYLPLLALTKAIGRDVFSKHLGPRYWRAARIASAALRAGEAALPCLDD
ncbi:conserved protein of unknown function (plasmid) [Rhodovastum atsumiense]|uniref:Uncharacterized protein n=1 Tax=Rhodovastum atsumiense TaxID=504468 RepID=A0A5M6IK11_9PROT|nr:hypothetical protein [Rhodovastum atsumiense]KAA5608606.1 hypothetical protein F1189_28210 [Rhodovastum atsumiense]CAH2605883.1 conserved protein of unknown function [Rhodovastum atsumiense]